MILSARDHARPTAGPATRLINFHADRSRGDLTGVGLSIRPTDL
jgi:hypothetical protein